MLATAAGFSLAIARAPARRSSLRGSSSIGVVAAPGSGTGPSATTLSAPPLPAAGAAAAALSAGRTRPNTIASATSASAAGVAALRTRSMNSSCFHSGWSAALGIASTLNGTLISLTESPRSLEKPIASCTSAVSFSTSSPDSGVLVVLPLGAVVTRWLTTTAALSRLTLPVDARVTRTVLSTS